MVLRSWAVPFVSTTPPLVHLVTMILLVAAVDVGVVPVVVVGVAAVVEGSMIVEAAEADVVDVGTRPTVEVSVTSKARR